MSRYVINDVLWGDLNEIRDVEDGEVALVAPIVDEQDLNLPKLCAIWIEKMWGERSIASEECADIIRGWVSMNRKFMQPRLNKIEWDRKANHVAGKPGFAVYLFVEDKCREGFYDYGNHACGTDIFRLDDPDLNTILTVPYESGRGLEAHETLVCSIVDALNAAEELKKGGAYERVDRDGRFTVQPTNGA